MKKKYECHSKQNPKYENQCQKYNEHIDRRPNRRTMEKYKNLTCLKYAKIMMNIIPDSMRTMKMNDETILNINI